MISSSSHRPALVIFALAALLLLSALAAPAFAHSIPATYTIVPNAQFADKSEVPQQLAMSFSERPDPKVSYIRVVDSQGQRIDKNDFAVTGDHGRQAAVTIDTSNVKDGIYTVSWFTMSLDDGHIAEGAYVFGVGKAMVPAGGGSGETRAVTSYADAVAKWPLLVAQAAVVGGTITHVILHKKVESRAARRFSIIVLASAGAMAASATGIVFLQAGGLAEAAGVSVTQALQSLVASSPSGAVWLYRLAASAIVAGSIVVYMKIGKKHLLYTALAAGAFSLFSNSMLSHNSAAPFLPELATALDWVHFMAVSAWVGGLFYLAAVFAPATRRSPRQLATALPSFSLVATVSLGVIGVTGIYMAWVHLHTLDSLLTTPYGISLAIKLGAALPMVLLGAYHQLKLHLEIVVLAKSGGQEYAATSCFGRTIKAEALVGIGVLFAASLLTITSPPAEAMDQQHHQTGPHYMNHVNMDGTDAMLEITPFQPGVNTFTVTLSEGGQPPQNIASVILRFTNVDAGVGPLIATLQKTGDGVYSAAGGYLSQPGEWKMDLIAQRVNAYDLNHSFTEKLESGSMSGMSSMPGMESTAETPPSFDSFAALALGLAAAVAGGSAFYARQSRLQMKKTLAALGQ